MIQTSSGYLAAVNRTSREWSARLASSGTAINAEIMSVTVHKGTRGDELNVGTMYAPYFEATIRGYSGASLLGSTLTFDLGLTVSGATEWATIATGTVISAKAQGNDLLLTLAGPISALGDQTIESTSTAVTDVVTEIQTKLGTTVTCRDGITSLTGTLAAAMTGQTIRGALQSLAAFFGGYVTEDATGQVVIGGLSQTSTTAISPDTYQEEPELSTGTYEITGWRVFVDSETYYLEGSEPYMDTACQFMTQAQFNAVKAGVIGQIFRGGVLDQTLGNPLIEPWDVLTLSVSADAMPRLGAVTIIYDGGVSVRIESPVTTDDEQPAQVVGPLSGQVAEAAAAADSAKTSAQEALEAAQEVNNHFYVDSAGLHVTLLESSPSTGQNILIDSDGMDIRDGTTVMAHFGANAILGEDAAVHAEVTSAGLKVFGANGTSVVGAIGYDDCKDGSSYTKAPYLILGANTGQTNPDYRGPYSVSFGLSTSSPGEYGMSAGWNAHANNVGSVALGAHVTVDGMYSFATGYHSTASGSASFAEGEYTTASGRRSHAQNIRTIAAKYGQTALGTWNEEDTASTTTHPDGDATHGEYAVIVGNGSGPNNRSNALTVGWDGGVTMLGDLSVGGDASMPGDLSVGGDASIVGGLTLAGHDSPIGTLAGDTASKTLTNVTASTSWQEVSNVLLTQGRWLIKGWASFNGSTAGTRYIYITTNSAPSSSTVAAVGNFSQYMAANAHGLVSGFYIADVGSTSTYRLYIKTTAGTPAVPYCQLEAIRIR